MNIYIERYIHVCIYIYIYICCMYLCTDEPNEVTRGERVTVGKANMGSALMGSFFPNLSKFITFAAAPLVLTPFVRNQDRHRCGGLP